MTTEQLTPEEIYAKYDYLAEVTIYKMFDNPDRFASSIGMQKEDLFQLARMGLFKGCKTHYTKDHGRTLKNHLITNIRWYVNYHIDRMTVGDRIYKSQKPTEDNLATVISMSNAPQYDDENKTTYYDIVAVDNINNFDSPFSDPENTLVSKDNVRQMLSLLDKLNEEERELIEFRLGENPLTYREIGEIKGVTKQRIEQKYRVIKEKCRNYLKRELTLQGGY